MAVVFLLLAVLLAFPVGSLAAFGLTTTTDSYAVDTGAGLVFKVRRTDNGSSTQSPGDIMSMVYNGVEFQNQSRGSQINSGFDWIYNYTNLVTVSANVDGTNYIKITVVCGDPTSNQGRLTHYYIARNGYPHIHMATSFTQEPQGQALARFIVRIPSTLLPNGPPPSDIRDTTYTVEAADVFGLPNGETRSKHYSNHRLLDWFCTGATGSGVGVFMMRDSQEGGSGGPFYRCLINQCGGDQEIYDIINYGEAQTEAFRTGILNGPYTLVFNNGQPPAEPLDYAWLETAGLNLTNFVPASGRGAVAGTVSGVPTGFQAVVGFANTTAQYWAIARNGVYTTPRMIPGTYTATLYKQELAVATASVTVNAGATNTLNVVSSQATPACIFKLGDWDGTPAGFLNASNMAFMHPSDVRNASWAMTDFTLENNPTPQFPAIQARQVNGVLTLRFNLTAAQAAVGHTLRIGITTAYNGGRPKVTVNGWTSSNPAAPSEPDTRTFTVGTYRGNNILYTYNVPASAFAAGQNVLTIFPISGSSDLGGWLSAGYVFDCVQMDGAPVAPLAPTDVTATPNASQVSLSWTPVFNAASYKIKRATAPGGPYTILATNVVARFDDAPAFPGLQYCYVVSSVNSAGESAHSAEVVASANPAMALYLPCDENSGSNTADATGNGWNGTLLDGASWAGGRTGSSVNLNGTTNYVSLPAGVVSALNDFTIAAWVNQNSVSTWARVFDFGNDTIRYMFLTPRSSSGTIRFAITIGSSGGEQQINGTSALPTGWHHVAVTLRGQTGILFVDGVPVGTNNAMTLKPSQLNRTPNNFIGKSQWPDPYLNGRVDDLRIYSDALSPGEVATLVTPLAAPNGFTATVGDRQVTLNWNTSPNATSYRILRSLASGGPYTLITTVGPTSYTNTALLNGTNYFYVVQAANAAGTSANSMQVAARPVSATPPLCVVTLDGGVLTLAWPADHVGWRLQAQTNSLTTGLGTSWVEVPGSTATNRLSSPIDLSNGSVFYRLVYP